MDVGLDAVRRAADEMYDSTELATERTEQRTWEVVVAMAAATPPADMMEQLARGYGGAMESTFEAFLASYEGMTETQQTRIEPEE